LPSNFSEDLDKSLFPTPVDYVLENSRVKTTTVAQNLKNDWYLIIGADTVVVLDEKIYEKPADKEDAFKMLSKYKLKIFNEVSFRLSIFKD
jgi:septum formation protein